MCAESGELTSMTRKGVRLLKRKRAAAGPSDHGTDATGAKGARGVEKSVGN